MFQNHQESPAFAIRYVIDNPTSPPKIFSRRARHADRRLALSQGNRQSPKVEHFKTFAE